MLFFQLKASIHNASKLLRHHRSTIATSSQVLRRYWSLISDASEISHDLHHNRNYDEIYFVNLLEKKIKRIHASLVKNGMQTDQILGKLLRLYTSTGYVEEARKFFYQCYISKVAGLAVFNAAIIGLGLAKQGLELESITIFNNLVKTQATYWNVLVACVHSGEVEFCHYVLGKIFKNLSIEPTIEHLGTYIDCLARRGEISKAFDEVRVMVYKPSFEIIVSILWRCQTGEAGETNLAIAFVKFLERKGISYKVTRQIYTRLQSNGIIWPPNVKILRQRRIGQSIG